MLVLILITLVVGLFYTLAPHRIHIASGIGAGLSHSTHVTFGIVMLAVSLILMVSRNRREVSTSPEGLEALVTV